MPEGKPPPEPFEAMVRLLAYRPHSKLELKRKLMMRGCDAGAVDLALDRGAELGYLDDTAYARSVVRQRSASRGGAAIGAELAARGVSREVAGQALGELDPDVQVEAAVRLLRRMPTATAKPALLLARLQRRGFSTEIVRRAWRLLEASP